MSLCDITNTLSSPKSVSKKKRLSDGSFKVYQYTGTRKHIELVFQDDAEKLQFESRIELVKRKHGLKSMKDVFTHLLDKTATSPSTADTLPEGFDAAMENAKHGHFVCQTKSIFELISSVSDHHIQCKQRLQVIKLDHNGHVGVAHLQCSDGHTLHWSSSDKIGKQYTLNYKMMVAYLCSGITPIQYERFSDFADYGRLTDHFRNTSIVTIAAVVDILAKESVHFALFDEIQTSKEHAEDGITIMTDARHACRKNSYHTDHVALGHYTHKVINIQHITKKEERCSQKHETVGCDNMYADFESKNVNVKVHVHDRNMSINKTIKSKGNIQNCNEKWHGTRPITKGLKKISTGAKKNIGKTWHPQLADKGSRLRNHMYYALDNCDKDAAQLRKSIDSCISHFQNKHEACHGDSPCHTQNYVPDFDIMTDPIAVTLLTKFLHTLVLYKNAEDYVLSKDTYYVESFNNACLIYLDKRIHYKDTMYMLRIQLAVLDWNYHVDRPYTSRSKKQQANHPRRHLGKKHYKKKKYIFVHSIWDLLISTLGVDYGLDAELDNDDDDDASYTSIRDDDLGLEFDFGVDSDGADDDI